LHAGKRIVRRDGRRRSRQLRTRRAPFPDAAEVEHRRQLRQRAEKLEFNRLLENPEFAAPWIILDLFPAQKKIVFCARPTCFVFRLIITPKTSRSNLIEAMAFGLPIVTTRWRSRCPKCFRRIIPDSWTSNRRNKSRRAPALLASGETGENLRENFLPVHARTHLANIAEAIRSVE
jgi:hypothetical protein